MVNRVGSTFVHRMQEQTGAPPPDLAAIIAYFAPGVAELRARLPELLSPEDSKSLSVETERLSAAGVPSGLTMRVAGLDALYSALDIVEMANEAKRSVEMVAAV
jgi:glutamate dehydrogenase